MTISKDDAILYDKYYTKNEIAAQCLSLFEPYLPENTLLIEPSAGAGAFIDASVSRPIIGFDILPEHPLVIKNDFLNQDVLNYLTPAQKEQNLVCVGNPPFGKRANIGIQFLNLALEKFKLVGFIVPIQFRKWSVQSKINISAKLVMDYSLEEESFELMGKPYKIRSSFQVWSLKHENEVDLRIPSKPSVNHPDFEMWQFNRTDEAAKYFDYDWDFAVPRQGFQDYNFKAYKKEDCDRKKQWIFFKTSNKKVLQKLLNMDFVALSQKNSGIPGFGKADVVEKYCQMR